MTDATIEELGAALVDLHKWVLSKDSIEDFNISHKEAVDILCSWLSHPLERNWSLVRDIENIIEGKSTSINWCGKNIGEKIKNAT